jgi:hypothetical protein
MAEMGFASWILASIAALMIYLIAGPLLGARLQELRLPGLPRLDFPGRSLRAWGEYLDPKRYQSRASWYIGALWVLNLAAPIMLVIGFLVL